MQETKNITSVISINLNNSTSLYHAIQGFMHKRQGKNDPNDAFELIFENIYETMELTGGDNILRSKQLTKNGSQASTKKEKEPIYQMKAM